MSSDENTKHLESNRCDFDPERAIQTENQSYLEIPILSCTTIELNERIEKLKAEFSGMDS